MHLNKISLDIFETRPCFENKIQLSISFVISMKMSLKCKNMANKRHKFL